MYIILNSKLERVGALTNNTGNGTPFYHDVITQQIADEDQQLSIQNVPDTTSAFDPNGNTKNWSHTLDSINVPYHYPDTKNIKEGNSLAYQDPNNGRWYIMRLTSVTDVEDMSGNHYKEATGINLCIWKLGKTIHYAQKLLNANSNKAFSELLADTGWYYDQTSEVVGGSADVEFDGTTSDQAMLQQLCQLYGAEIDAYVLFPKAVKMADGHSYVGDFQVALKRVEIRRQMGHDNGARIVYGRNATNIQRSVIDDSLYTRLYVYGPNGATCACSMTDGKPYVEDDVANEFYNPQLPDASSNYLEGAITSQTIKSPERLATWGLEQLSIFNHPRANYTVNVSHSLATGQGNQMVMDANLGDTFRVIDEKMDPVLHAQARVIRKQLSFSDPAANNITLGEYTTVNVVTPKFISDLQQGEYNRINQILEAIKSNPNALSCTVDKPNGCTWHYNEPQKRFIAHIYVLGEDITHYIKPRGFIWDLYQGGQINSSFRQDHATNGQTLVLNNNIKLNNNTPDPTQQTPQPSNNPSVNINDNSSSSDFDINSQVSGDESVTGEIRLTIDTDYITDKQRVNFNTDRIKHLYTVAEWTDFWQDPRVGALQYINYNPNDQCYYAALVYYGRNRPRDNKGHLIHRLSHTEIARLDKNGNYIDSMVNIFSHHDSNFGLDYTTPGGPYIWTTFEDYHEETSDHNNRYWLVRMKYNPDQVMQLHGLPTDNLIMHFGEDGCFANYDNSSDTVLISHDDTSVNPSHPVDFYHAQDLLNNRQNAQPFKTIRLTDYGLDPKNEDYDISNPDADSDKNTFQSGCLHYPYYFFDSGNVNMSDQRTVWCIDIEAGQKVFSKPLDMSQFDLNHPDNIIGQNPGNYVFAEPETLNWTLNESGELVFLFGLNVGYENNRTGGYDYDDAGVPIPDYKHYELLYQVGMDIN